MECKKNMTRVKALLGGILLALFTPYNNEPAVAKLALTIADGPIAGTTFAAAKRRRKTKKFNFLPTTKPLRSAEIKPDKPLPAEDLPPKLIPETPTPRVPGGLSESQIKAMKIMLEDAKQDAEAGRLDEAIGKYYEFPDGPWKSAADQLKTEATDKYLAIEAAIKVADEASKAKDKAKFTKALTDLLAAVEKAK
jgi:hypothetical protein